jgi:multidrug efflux pump subunit AcrA (membrane-fusion protein)
MLVSVNVRKEYHPNAVVVPRTAVFQSENGANVFTVGPLETPQGGAGAAASGGAARGGARAGGGGAPGGAPPVRLMQAHVVPVQLGLQTDTLSEVRSAEIQPGTTVITTRPDALQDKSVVAIGGPASRAGGAAQ